MSLSPDPARQLLSAGTLERERGLRRMKAMALGLLVALAVVFAVAFPLQDVHPVWGYVRAAAEGGMVGALADWFAVTALFRHPMGIPVPHTALIPRKKDQLGAALTEFVQENFLDSDVAREKVEGIEVAAAAGGWLRRPENAERAAREVATAARGAMAAADDDAVQELLRQLMQRHMVEPEWSPTLAGVLQDVVTGRHHERVVDLVVKHTGDWVAAHPEMFVETVRRRSPEWSPDLVDRLLAERLHAEALKYLAGIRDDRDHEARRAVDDWLTRLSAEMRDDPHTRASVERFKHSLFADERLRAWAGRAWTSLRDSLLDALEDPASDLHRALVAALRDLGARLQEDPVLRDRVDGHARAAAAYALSTYGPAVTGVIEETVARWDGDQTARTLELFVGKDLQYIRINGSIVGALAGLTIHAVATLFL